MKINEVVSIQTTSHSNKIEYHQQFYESWWSQASIISDVRNLLDDREIECTFANVIDGSVRAVSWYNVKLEGGVLQHRHTFLLIRIY